VTWQLQLQLPRVHPSRARPPQREVPTPRLSSLHSLALGFPRAGRGPKGWTRSASGRPSSPRGPAPHAREIIFYHHFVRFSEMVNRECVFPPKGPKALRCITVRNPSIGNPPILGYHVSQQVLLLMLRANRCNLNLKHMILQASGGQYHLH